MGRKSGRARAKNTGREEEGPSSSHPSPERRSEQRSEQAVAGEEVGKGSWRSGDALVRVPGERLGDVRRDDPGDALRNGLPLRQPQRPLSDRRSRGRVFSFLIGVSGLRIVFVPFDMIRLLVWQILSDVRGKIDSCLSNFSIFTGIQWEFSFFSLYDCSSGPYFLSHDDIFFPRV